MTPAPSSLPPSLQSSVQAAVDQLVATGAETGLQMCVLHEGEVVVDAVSGVADERTGRPVDPGTLFFAASAGKGVATTVAHVLAERGALDYGMRVADVWPEFGAHGKDRVTLRDVLVHAAGVPGLWPQVTPEDLGDWDRVCAFVADQRPWWEPGTRTGYHALTFGFLLGETVRRATGRTLAEALRDEVAAPLGIEDELHFGVPGRLLDRVARQGPPGAAPPPPAPGSPPDRAVPPGVQPTADFANRADVLGADVPAQATTTARAVARMYAALLGHVDGVRLVSSERLRLMAATAFTGVDQVMGMATSWALGYSQARLGAPARPGSTFGMVGSNGCGAYADIDAGVAVAVMRNRAVGDFTALRAVDAAVAAQHG
ncbi:serine hydrolase domain-containing protein [Isoptericola sp. NPDC019693]|uniref:serine hydrolase domain-containing protein n=1 Tax=Isoptericola sp. NPDC019693 TaxID=3364009 RepID=UPI003796B693